MIFMLKSQSRINF